jgi:hypothetical protein
MRSAMGALGLAALLATHVVVAGAPRTAAALGSSPAGASRSCPQAKQPRRPNLVNMDLRLSAEVDANDAGAHFIAIKNPYSIRDGRGGSLTAVVAALYPGATQLAQDIFSGTMETFWAWPPRRT